MAWRDPYSNGFTVFSQGAFNQIVGAYWERAQAAAIHLNIDASSDLYPEYADAADANSIVQRVKHPIERGFSPHGMRRNQQQIEALALYYLDPAEPWKLASGFNFLTLARFRQLAGLHADGFARYNGPDSGYNGHDDPAFTGYGIQEPGDLIGNWSWKECQNALDAISTLHTVPSWKWGQQWATLGEIEQVGLKQREWADGGDTGWGNGGPNVYFWEKFFAQPNFTEAGYRTQGFLKWNNPLAISGRAQYVLSIGNVPFYSFETQNIDPGYPFGWVAPLNPGNFAAFASNVTHGLYGEFDNNPADETESEVAAVMALIHHIACTWNFSDPSTFG